MTRSEHGNHRQYDEYEYDEYEYDEYGAPPSPPYQPVWTEDRPDVAPAAARAASMRLRHVLALGIVVMAMLSGYRLIYSYELESSGALFIGLPVLVAMLLIYVPRGANANATGTVVRAITLVVAAGVVILPEGFICWLMMLPLLLLVGVVAVAMVNSSEKRNARPFMAVAWLPLLLLSGEGLFVGDLVSPNGRATATQRYSLRPEEVVAALSETPEFDSPDGVLGLGFPEPVSATGSGLSLGDERIIRFTGDPEAPPARLHLVVSERSDGRVVFSNAGDSTHLAKWLTLTEAEVKWSETADGGTEVSWTLRWHRELHPGLYFGPVQQIGMTQAADYLLDTVVG